MCNNLYAHNYVTDIISKIGFICFALYIGLIGAYLAAGTLFTVSVIGAHTFDRCARLTNNVLRSTYIHSCDLNALVICGTNQV